MTAAVAAEDRFPGAAPRLCVFIRSFGDGGVERMLVHLAGGMAAAGVRVNFVVGDRGAPFLGTLPATVTICELARQRPAVALASFLKQTRPDAVISAKLDDDETVLRARVAAGIPVRVVQRIGTALSARARARAKNPVSRVLLTRRIRRLLSGADTLIAVSEGVARDVAAIARIDLDRVQVIRNPVVTPALAGLAAQPVDHPWFTERSVPVLLGAGGLRRQKDFQTLLRAFARVREDRDCRLLILGRGRQRERLEKLAARLGVAKDFEIVGFVDNPYAWMAKADLFVLSSLWEGSPNVLAESLAVGLPVVSTDCPSGPREILQDGRYGELVPVADPRALAEAIERTLVTSPAPEILKGAVEHYTVERSAREYMRVLGFTPRTV